MVEGSKEGVRVGDVIRATWHGHPVYVTVIDFDEHTPLGHVRADLGGAEVLVQAERGEVIACR